MDIEFHPTFKKHYKRRISPSSSLRLKTQERVKLFTQNSNNPVLKDHGLSGEKSTLRSFRITGDIRIVYKKISDSHVLFLDIGTHNQVY